MWNELFWGLLLVINFAGLIAIGWCTWQAMKWIFSKLEKKKERWGFNANSQRKVMRYPYGHNIVRWCTACNRYKQIFGSTTNRLTN